MQTELWDVSMQAYKDLKGINSSISWMGYINQDFEIKIVHL